MDFKIKTPLFITFEGIDGCGKTTQIRRLKNFLTEHNYEVVTVREPGGTEISELIRNILLHSKNQISPTSELLLFNSARSILVQEIIKPALEQGKIVICDRFFDSTLAYQGFGRGLNLDDVKKCNKIACYDLIPDLTIFLSVSLEISKSRTDRTEFDRFEQAGDEFFKRVINGFEQIAIEEPNRVFKICSEDPIDEVSQKIIDLIINC
ncbi:MAG TPA: dTMP kinase [Candidatus Kapabacteria bacterium]|nr:dTMP kinase [Candidatus Kapabacteria bacterium]HPO61478.1 dTMP kinase [Candidatus Kapabacteria bacterium]